jgi:general nucleoside transport system ATP-binding protein
VEEQVHQGLPPAAPSVELVGITKRFPGVIANQDVTLRVMPATIHAIVGENGAGKSTLMKILYGMQSPDEGRVSVEGREVHFRSPKDAIDAGIGMVHQHFMLAGQLTVLENMVLGSEPRRGIQIDFASAKQRILELGDTYGLDVDPDALVESLTVGERQRVEILKVLYRGARILILDEPTAVLVPQEVEELFGSMRELTREGVTIMFISHKLDEVLAVADEITVIRGGRTVDTVLPTEVDARKLAELMVGSELPTPETGPSTVTDRVELELEGVSVVGEHGRAVLSDISFRVHGGEVVGIAGVEGNGQTPLVETIMGLRAPASGRIRVAEHDATEWTTLRVREAGVGLIPEDRTSQGLILSAPLWENVMLGHQSQPPFSRGMWIDRKAAVARTEEVIRAFDVRTPGPDVPALALSGGNQQKLAVGREMLTDPRVLVASQPTRGIDVGAQAAIWEQIKEAREVGLAVLLISADLEELLGLSDRLFVILRGRLVAELDPSTVSAEELGSYMTGARGEAVA